MMRTAEKAAVVSAIFAAPVGRVSPPMKLNGSWAVFVVRKAIPSRPSSFASVREAVLTQLTISRKHRIATGFSDGYVSRWRAKTNCRSGYLAPGCPQYRGSLGAYEDPFSRQAHPLLSEQVLGG
jgi:hypothetical protein